MSQPSYAESYSYITALRLHTYSRSQTCISARSISWVDFQIWQSDSDARRRHQPHTVASHLVALSRITYNAREPDLLLRCLLFATCRLLLAWLLLIAFSGTSSRGHGQCPCWCAPFRGLWVCAKDPFFVLIPMASNHSPLWLPGNLDARCVPGGSRLLPLLHTYTCPVSMQPKAGAFRPRSHYPAQHIHKHRHRHRLLLLRHHHNHKHSLLPSPSDVPPSSMPNHSPTS